MGNHGLARLKMKLFAIEMHGEDVRLEGQEVGDAADLRIGLGVRPHSEMCVPNVVVAAQSFIRAEGLPLDRSECSLINVGAWNVPSRCEARLIENHGRCGVRDEAFAMADHE